MTPRARVRECTHVCRWCHVVNGRAPILAFLRKGRWFDGLPPALQVLIVGAGRDRRALPARRVPDRARNAGEGAVRDTRGHGARDPPHRHQPRPPRSHRIGRLLGRRLRRALGADHDRQHHRGHLRPALFLSAAEFERIVDEEPRHFRPFMNLLLDRYRTVFAFVAEMQGLPSEERLWRRIEGIASFWRDGAGRQPDRHPDLANRARADGRPLPAAPEHTARPPRGARRDRGRLSLDTRRRLTAPGSPRTEQASARHRRRRERRRLPIDPARQGRVPATALIVGAPVVRDRELNVRHACADDTGTDSGSGPSRESGLRRRRTTATREGSRRCEPARSGAATRPWERPDRGPRAR